MSAFRSFNLPVLDAAENLFFERELEAVAAKSYDMKYPQLKGRQLVPVKNDVDRGMETFKFKQYDMAGVALIANNYTDAIPMVNVRGKEFRVAIKPVVDGFQYSIQEIQNARRNGMPLEQREANAARRAIEEKIDAIIATGDSDTGLLGLLSLTNTIVYTPPNGTSGHTQWSTKTPLEILADLNALANTIVSTTNEVEIPDTIVMPTIQRQLIANTPISLAGATSVSIEEYFLKTNNYIKEIVSWYKCKGAGASGTDRAVAYRRDPDAIQAVIPLEAEFLPPQPVGFVFKIPAHARTAGVVTYYPMSICYADNI